MKLSLTFFKYFGYNGWRFLSYRRLVTFLFCLFWIIFSAYSQVTRGGLKGRVHIGAVSIAKASVVLVNNSTGERFSTVTDSRGNYVFFNLSPGVDYSLTVSGNGGQTHRDNLVITLGEDQVLDLDLSEVLDEVKVSSLARRNSRNVMGSGTSVGKKTILELPAFNRSLTDITKLTPQSNGLSMAGSNDKFNNITIDGAITNDAFGLQETKGIPGSSVGAQPISLDAIEEVQVVLSPYNVQYGNFTGGGINAVTRSGTNKLEGSAYMFTKNGRLTGKDPISKVSTTQFSEYMVGFRVGGPIIKDKLFYFVNYEFLQRSEPTLFNAGEEGSVITRDSAERVREFFKEKFNYDPGTYDLLPLITRNHKALLKLTYNISSKHKLSLRYNFVTGFKEVIERSSQAFSFSNGTNTLHNLQNIGVLELNSFLSSKASNSLIVSATTFENIISSNAPNGRYFPTIEWNTTSGKIMIGSGTSAKDTKLLQNIIELTDNFKLHHNNYIFTFGTHNEMFIIENRFTQRRNGFWYSKPKSSISDLEKIDNANSGLFGRYRASYATVDDGDLSRFALVQFSAYAQAEGSYWGNRLKLTLGMRVDLPVFFNKPLANPDFQKQFSLVNNSMPSRFLYSPRFGFNLDADGRKNIIIRGGLGLFAGRVPLRWIANAFANDGIRMASIDKRDPKFAFNPDVSQIKNLERSTSFEVNTTDKNFHFPQVLRTNLGLDFKLPGHIQINLEGIFTTSINNVYYQKLGLNEVKDNGKTKVTKTPFSDKSFPVYEGSKYLVDGKEKENSSYKGGIFNMRNTNQGYTYNLSVQVRKDFRFPVARAGVLSLMAAYTYTRAFDISSAGRESAASGYEGNLVPANVDFNNPPLAISNYELRHRVIATVSYTIPYSENVGTTIFLFLRSNSGKPYSLTFNQLDLNGDGARLNDLLYIPTESEVNSDAKADQENKAAVNAFINSSADLRRQRGNFIVRNSLQMPWETVLDLRILQNFIANIKGHKHTFQLSLEIFNLTNLLNNNWGLVYALPYTSGGAVPIWGVSKDNKITMQRSKENNRPWTIKDTHNHGFDSRWQMQLGFRYIF